MSIFSNILGHTKSTLHGLLIGMGSGLTAGVAGAAMEFQRTGNVTSWQPYALAAAGAAVPAIVGALSKDPAPAPTYSQQARQVAEAIDQASQAYAAQKADEVIRNLQKQLEPQQQGTNG